MASINETMLSGRLTSDPNRRELPNGNSVVTFSLAVTRSYSAGKDNERREEISYIDCEAFGRMADNIAKFFKKGRPIIVKGRLKQDKWEDKEGGKRSKVLVHVENFFFMDSGGNKKEDTEEEGAQEEQAPKAPQQRRTKPPF